MNRQGIPSLLAVALLASVMALPMIPAQAVYPNLVVTDLRILEQYDTPEWIDGEVSPATVEVQATIHNNGGSPSMGYRIDYYWVDDDGADWLNGEPSNSFDISERVIEEGDTYKQPPMQWDILPDQHGSGALRVVLQPSGHDRDSTDNTFTNATHIAVHDIHVSFSEADRTLHNPADTRFVRVQVRNDGTVAETVGLAIAQETVQPAVRSGDIASSLQYDSLDVAPGETMESTLFVDYLFSGDHGQFTASFDIEATAYDRVLSATTPLFFNGEGAPPADAPVQLQRRDNDPLVVPESGAVTRGFSVTNVGDAPDTYRVQPVKDPAWTASVGLPGLDDGPHVRIALEPGQTQAVRMTLQAPDDAAPGAPTEAGIRVQSDRPMDPDDDPWPTDPVEAVWTYRVAGPAVRIEPAADWDLQPYRGDPVHASVVVHNDGTEPTPIPSNLRLVVSEGDDASATLAPPEVVERGASKAMQLNPPVVFTGEGLVVFTVDWLTPDTTIHQEPLQLEGFIHVPDATIHAADNLTAAPGETVGYRTGDHAFTVTNSGNAEETFAASANAAVGGVHLVSNPTFTLSPGQSRTVALDHHVPLPTGPLQAINVTLHVAISGRPDLNWTASTTTEILDENPPIIEPVALPVEWALEGTLPLNVTTTDETSIASVDVTHLGPDGRVDVHAMAAATVGDHWLLGVKVDEVGDHAFSFKAWDIHGNNATLDAGTVRVHPIPPPALTLTGPVEATVVSPNSTFQVNVTDIRPIADVKVQFEVIANEPFWQSTLDLDQGIADFNASAAPNGPFAIIVEATNDAGAKTRVVRNVIMEGQPETSSTDDQGEARINDKDTPPPSITGILLALLAMARRMRRRGGGGGTTGRPCQPAHRLHATFVPSHADPFCPFVARGPTVARVTATRYLARRLCVGQPPRATVYPGGRCT